MKISSEKWVEVFPSGKHTDMNGNVKVWTDADLDKIAGKYNSSPHDAPAVIGHPVLNAPAYGWVKKNMKRVGEKLLAQFRDLDPEFVKAVNGQRFPKRSASIYPDLTLRHVGWLGAMPPAIKGLADMAFSEAAGQAGEILSYEFNENLLENFISGGNEMDEKDKEIQELKAKLAELQAKIKEAEDLKKAAEAKSFAEKEAVIAGILAENEQLKTAARQKEFSEFAESLGTKLKPGHKKDIVNFMEILHDKGKYEFAEGGSQDAVEKFKTLLTDNMKEQFSFGEFATKDKAAGKATVSSQFAEMDNVNEEQLDMDVKVKSYMKQHNISSYAEAYKKVRSI